MIFPALAVAGKIAETTDNNATGGNYVGNIVNNSVINSSPKGNFFFRQSQPQNAGSNAFDPGSLTCSARRIRSAYNPVRLATETVFKFCRAVPRRSMAMAFRSRGWLNEIGKSQPKEHNFPHAQKVMILRARNIQFVRLAADGVRLLALVWLLTALPAWGANMARDYLIDVWTSENGLPDSSVTAIAQTPDGYLWAGTYNGLVRFDGVRFVTFDPANTPALVHARVRGLYVDSQGTLWINTYDGSLTTFRQRKFVLERRNTRLSEGEMTLVSSSSNQVVFLTSRGELLRKSLTAPAGEGWEELSPPGRGLGALCCEDGAGTLWYRDGDKHLWRWAGGRFEPLPVSVGLVGTNINCLTTDPRGRLWVGTDNGFAVWDGSKFQIATPTNSETSLGMTFLAVTAGEHIWAVARGCVCEAGARRWILAPEPPRNIFTDNSGQIRAQEDHHGGMWFYNYGRGLIHVSAAGDVRQLTPEDGFPGDRVYCLFEDREGDWWAGLDASGLVRVREAQFHTAAASEGSLAKAAKSVCEDANGVVWIGLLSGGLERWQDGVTTNLTAPDGTASGSVFCVCPDAAGRLWASAGNEDLFVRTGGEFKRVSPVLHGVKAILTDPNDRIWVGTTSGLFFAAGDSPGEFQFFKGLARRSMRALAEDKAGTLWVGAGNGDLYHIVNDTVTTFHPTDNQESGAVWLVLAEADGTVWVGTFRGGLLRFRDGRFTRYGKAEGLPDNVICQILDDGRGNLWLGSRPGHFSRGQIGAGRCRVGEKQRCPVCGLWPVGRSAVARMFGRLPAGDPA